MRLASLLQRVSYMDITEEMKRVKVAARRAFQGIQGVEGVGLGDASTLIVYLRDADASIKIPDSFEGFVVKKIITGLIKAIG